MDSNHIFFITLTLLMEIGAKIRVDCIGRRQQARPLTETLQY